VFDGAPIRAQLFVASVSITNDAREVLAVALPTRSRAAGAWMWTFLLNGCFFGVFIGAPKLTPSVSAARADQLENPVVANLGTQEASKWTGLTDVIRSIGRTD
jgi:hypothetical protein